MDKARFTNAVEQYQAMVYRTALHALGSPQDADDAVQEVFLRLFRYRGTFEGGEHLRRWLLRVTVNYCRDVLKSPWRKRRVSWEEVPETPVFDRPEQAALYREVMALPGKYRVATQRMMLRRYAEQNNLFVVDEYTDLPGGERVSRFLWPVPVDLNQAKSLEYRYGEEVQAFDLK